MANELLTIRLNSVNEILTLQEEKVVKVRVGFELKYCNKINVCGARTVSAVGGQNLTHCFDPQHRGMLVVWIMANQHDDCVDPDGMRKLPRSVSSF